MSPEDIAKFKDIGEQVFSAKNMFAMANPDINIGYILSLFSAISSGLTPEDLDAGDLNYLVNVFGNNWYDYYTYYINDIQKSE